VRSAAVVLMMIALAGCGGSTSIHYNEPKALECVRQTNSLTIHSMPKGILIAFASADGVSAIERVAVAFAPQPVEIIADSGAPTQLGATKPDWTERRGDAEVWGVGPYEPRLARLHRVSDTQAKASAKALGHEVRAAIDACLKKNER
jgi:hypothetical protein